MGLTILAALLLGGCASAQPKPIVVNTLPAYRPARASALAFDPPATAGHAPLDLDREGRSSEAFVGYDSLTATFSYLRTDDRQFIQGGDQGGRGDFYERRAISTKIGVSYR
jgi:hypothetical protein